MTKGFPNLKKIADRRVCSAATMLVLMLCTVRTASADDAPGDWSLHEQATVVE